MANDVRFPNNTQRLCVIGRTGTGKTQAGCWHLSGKNFKTFPWVVFDTKGDEMLREIRKMSGSKHIKFADTPAKQGLHFVTPLPHEMKSDEAEQFLWKLHKRGNIGIFIDEGYMLDKFSDALIALYTQGRSKHIPMITLSQKPKYLTQFTFSEADFFQVFHLNDVNDRKRISEFMPAELNQRLPDFHSVWYDVGRNSVRTFSPVPPRETILENFEAQLRLIKRAI